LFPDAADDDGMLEVGVVTARSVGQWLRVLSRVARGRPEGSPFVEMTRGRKVAVRLSRKLAYEADGGVRRATKRLKVRVVGRAIVVRAPRSATFSESKGRAGSDI
jgi:diacylglycerol kinase family enzyme